MGISAFCIRRPVFTTLLMVALLVGGFAGYRQLPVAALPNVDFPTIQVSASLPGASPETMATSVAAPLERQFSTIAGVSAITSTSYLGNAQITLQFDLDRNVDGAALDVQSAIAAVTPRLPREMRSPPSARKVNPADQPIFFIALSSDTLPLYQVDDIANTVLVQRMATLPGVAQVSVYGSQKYAVRVAVDPGRLEGLGLSVSDIRDQLAASASVTPPGIISGKDQLYNLEVTGQPRDAAGFRNLIALWKDGAPIRIGDIGTVEDGIEDARSIGYLNGKQAIVMAIQRQPDANTIEVVRRIRALLPEFRRAIPASITMTPMFDRSEAVRHAIDDVEITLLITIALVIAVIYLFLHDRRATLIAATAVPMSILFTYGVMALLDYSLNNVSLLALTLCVGFVVDDAIVVMENILRRREEGRSALEAALVGSGEIGFTILSMTLSLVAVFIPVLFMGGLVGRLFSEFAVTISVAILVSGFISLTLTPMLCAYWLKDAGHTASAQAEGGRLFAAMQHYYLSSLEWALRHRGKMLVLTVASIGLSVWLLAISPKGFFPLEDNGFVFANTEAAQDISYEAMVEKQQQVADIIRQDPAVENVFYAVGGGRALNTGRIFFGLKPRGQRDSVFAVIARIRKKTASVEGIQTFMQPTQNIQIGGRASKSMYQYTLLGSDLPALYASAEKLLAAMQQDPLFVDATSDLQLKSLQAVIAVNPEAAARVGVTFEDIRQTLYAAYGDAQVATLYTPTNDYAVVLEVTENARQSPEDVGKLTIRPRAGEAPGASNQPAVVSLSSIATITRGVAPLAINHQGQLPAVTLSFNLKSGAALSDAVRVIDGMKARLSLPDSVSGGFQGSAQMFQESARGQGMLVLLVILVIYIILGMLYESFRHPLTILSGLPSAGIGALIALRIVGMDVSIIALVGLILLIGIVKKNAIMMVDVAVVERGQGASPEAAIRTAARLRFRPIMMTTMAALFGTLPIALGLGAGAELRQPLGVAVVGGLLTSQLLTLYITPVVYLALERLGRRPRH